MTHQNAVQRLIDHRRRRDVLVAEVQRLQATIDRARITVGEVNVASQAVYDLKRKRRGFLASLFLGREQGDTTVIDAEIGAAEKHADGVKLMGEGAEAAIDELIAQQEPLRQELVTLATEEQDLRYAALLALAEEQVPAYLAAVTSLEDAYANMLGAFMAAEELADHQAGRPHVLTIFAETVIELPNHSIMVQVPALTGFKFVRDIRDRIRECGHAALQRLNAACQHEGAPQ